MKNIRKLNEVIVYKITDQNSSKLSKSSKTTLFVKPFPLPAADLTGSPQKSRTNHVAFYSTKIIHSFFLPSKGEG